MARRSAAAPPPAAPLLLCLPRGIPVCGGRTETFPGWPGRGLWGPPALTGQSCGGQSFAEPSAAPSSRQRASTPHVPPGLRDWPSVLLGRALGRCPLRWELRPRHTGMLGLREAVRLLWPPLRLGFVLPPAAATCPPQPCTRGPFSCGFSRKPPYLKANTKDGSPRISPPGPAAALCSAPGVPVASGATTAFSCPHRAHPLTLLYLTRVPAPPALPWSHFGTCRILSEERKGRQENPFQRG